jgi:DNA polymerase-3 subunit alpha
MDFLVEGRQRVAKYIRGKYGTERVGLISAYSDVRENNTRLMCLHAAGIIIGKTDLSDYVPLCRYTGAESPLSKFDLPSAFDYWGELAESSIVSQYGLLHLGECGLVNFDLLVLETLDVIKQASEHIRRNGGQHSDFSIDAIPLDDAAAFALFSAGNTADVFQFDSEGMREILRTARPGRFTDLAALNALYHPGLMENIPAFIALKHGEEPIIYPDPRLEDILKETYGIIVYREQVMRIIQRVAGYTAGRANLLWHTMAKKKADSIAAEKERFVAAASDQGFSAEDAARLFETIIPFAGIAFSKSHAIAYTLLSYQIAYLKAHFPKEFDESGAYCLAVK